MSTQPFDIPSLLLRHEGALWALVRREAGVALLRFETVEDLVQGARHEALRASGSFSWQGEAAFVGWLHQVARRHLSARRDYWFACKRHPGALLRLTLSGEHGRGLDRPELADSATGPATFAHRRELLVQATRAMALLLPRDRDIITWVLDGAGAPEIASRLSLGDDAAEKARTRALERLRKAFSLVARADAPQNPPPPPPSPPGPPSPHPG